MNIVRRASLGVMLLAFLFAASSAGAQVLKQIPAGPIVVFKINNPQAISDRIAAFAARTGLSELEPELKNPLAVVQRELGYDKGIDIKGEAAIALFGQEPQVLLLVPVTDYAAFLTNFQDVKDEGNNISSFQHKDAPQTFYAVKRDKYAALSPTKELLAKEAGGLQLSAMAQKQMDSADAAVFANLKVVGEMALPELRQGRQMITQGMDAELQNAPINQKFVPAIKALVSQALNVAEGALESGQGATLSVKLTDQGINATGSAEFAPESYGGKLLSSVKNSKDPLTAGLPDRKYFGYGGMVMDSASMLKAFDDFAGPALKELQGVEEAKSILNMVEAFKAATSAYNRIAMGYPAPTGQPGQQPLIQQIAVYGGDSAKLGATIKQMFQGMNDLMAMLPQQGMTTKTEILPGAKTVDGATLDQVSMKFQADANTPEGAMMMQMMQIMYGGMSYNGFMGPVDAKTYVAVMGVDEKLLTDTIAAARKQEEVVGLNAPAAAVAAQLPQERVGVMFIFVDNIVDTALKYMAQFGMAAPIKMPENMAPIGMAIGAEGPALRVDTHISYSLIENLISVGMQAAMGAQGGAPGGL